MASLILLSKLDSLQRCLSRISTKTPGHADILQQDLDLQDIIAINLERAVQICVDIAAHIIAVKNVPAPATMAESFDRLFDLKVISKKTAGQMKNAVGFRNISVHEYQKIDWLIVYRIITEHNEDFKDFARQIMAWAEKHEETLPAGTKD
ncbi:MAG: DUF86 domain-containing protein [Desulfuromonadaceae bacterium]|nr:DUF86 domain-containing protein [Desulfuromonadaceae bacterium]